MDNKLIRECPTCGEIIHYSYCKGFYRAQKKNSLCKRCMNKNRWKNTGYRDRISESMKLAWKDVKTRVRLTECQNRSEVRFSKREKMVLRMVGKDGKPNYNINACKFIDLLNDVYGWNLQHALNGKEICLGGYFPDGYDKDRNIIFEYDEPHHYYADGKLKLEDKDREDDILRFLNSRSIKPQFIRYDLKRDKLYIID